MCLAGDIMGANQRFDVTEDRRRHDPLGDRDTANGQVSDDFRRCMHDAISDAHAATSRPGEILMPWEQPSMSWIFGSDDIDVIPNIQPVGDYVEPCEPTSGPHLEPAAVIHSKPTFYSDAIAFNSKRACHLSERCQLDMLSQKWESLISINYSSFDLGLQVFGLPYHERVKIVAEVLGGKSPGTLTRRLSQITRFVNWAHKDAKRESFPVSAELIKNYIRHLRNNGAGHTAFKGFVEVMKFMKHVVGLDCDMAAFDSLSVLHSRHGRCASNPQH